MRSRLFLIITRSNLRYTIACVFLFVYASGYSQDCSQILDNAKASYLSGHLYEIPRLLEGCLTGYSRQQKVEAYELLTITYLYLDSLDKAENSYLNLLGADPEWDPEDYVNTEVEIEYLSKNFKTTPIFTLYPIKIGGNFSYVQTINVNGVDNTTNTNQSYKPRFGFQVGTGGDWNMSDKFSLGAEFWFSSKNYRYQNKLFPDPVTAPNGETPGDSIIIDYNTIGFEIPMFLRYTQQFNKWYPFVFGGYIFQYNLDYNAKPNYFNIDGIGNDQQVNPDGGKTLNIGSIRNNINHSVTAGAGVKYRVGYRYLLFEIRYAWGLKNVLNTSKQFDFKAGDNQDPVREYTFRYSQVDDDFRLNQIYFNLGFVYPLYKPRKIVKRRGLFGKKKKGVDNEN